MLEVLIDLGGVRAIIEGMKECPQSFSVGLFVQESVIDYIDSLTTWSNLLAPVISWRQSDTCVIKANDE
jgi:hypothetical protein